MRNKNTTITSINTVTGNLQIILKQFFFSKSQIQSDTYRTFTTKLTDHSATSSNINWAREKSKPAICLNW